MTDVACFCGCCYSFDGGAGACPRCGEYAVVRPGPAVAGTEHSQPEHALAANGDGPPWPGRSRRARADRDALADARAGAG